jgi:hypothetical protein
MFEVKFLWSLHERQCESLLDPGAVPDPPLPSEVADAVALDEP